MHDRKNPTQPEFPMVFSGLNELDALFWGLLPLLYFIPVFIDENYPLLVGLLALNLFWALGNRYRCEVDSTGIFLVRRILYMLPIERRKFLLDAYPELYDSWDCARAEGVFIHAWDSGEPDSEVFGPYLSERAQQRLCDALTRAIAQARNLCPTAPGHLRASPLNHWASSVQVVSRFFDGRPKTANALAALPLMGMQIPANSTLHFAEGSSQRWRDPRREDRLKTVDCADSTVLPWGQRILAGARLHLDFDSGQIGVEFGFDGPIYLDGRWVNGHNLLKFGPGGDLCAYTLAAPLTIRRLAILPPGSAIQHERAPHGREEARVELSASTYIRDRIYRRGRFLLLRPPWHISRYTFGLWRHKVAIEDYRLDLMHHKLQKIIDSAIL